jgi:hypothetical protein
MGKKANDAKSTKKKPVMGPNTGKKFSKDYQPTPQAKSMGAIRRYSLRDMLRVVPDNSFDGSTKDYATLVSKFLKIPRESVDLETIMFFRQIEKAILAGDTKAFRAMAEYSIGKPRQEDGPPPPVTPDEEVIRRKSQIDFGDGITFEV